MALIDFGGVQENVVTRGEFSLAKARSVLANETIGIIGYGPQGYGQSLYLRDNGVRVIIGQRKGGKGWADAIRDGWKEGKTLFSDIGEVVRRATAHGNWQIDYRARSERLAREVERLRAALLDVRDRPCPGSKVAPFWFQPQVRELAAKALEET